MAQLQHKQLLTSTLWTFRQKNILCDVTLVVEGHQVRGHKVILAANSQYFEQEFCGDTASSDHVLCGDVNLKCVLHLMKYMYTGCWDPTDCHLDETLLRTAQQWRMPAVQYISQVVNEPSQHDQLNAKEMILHLKPEPADPCLATDAAPSDPTYVSLPQTEGDGEQTVSEYEDCGKGPLFDEQHSNRPLRSCRKHKLKPTTNKLTPKKIAKRNAILRSYKKQKAIYEKEECPSCCLYVLPGTVDAHKLVCIKEGSGDLLPCNKCEQSFASQRQLTAHFRNVHEIGGKPTKYVNSPKHWACDMCAKSYAGRLILINHRFRAHNITNEHLKVFTCQELGCGFECLMKSMLIRHDQSCHQSEAVTCDLCGIQIKSISLKSHMTHVHSRVPDNWTPASLTCKSCGKNFTTRHKLTHHIKQKHSPLLHCELCSYQTCIKQEYDRHLIHKHKLTSFTTKKVHRCPHCEFITTAKSKLEMHLGTHREEYKTHQCPDCDYRTSAESQLNIHLAIHSTNITPTTDNKHNHAHLHLSGNKWHQSTNNDTDIKNQSFHDQADFVTDRDGSDDETYSMPKSSQLKRSTKCTKPTTKFQRAASECESRELCASCDYYILPGTREAHQRVCVQQLTQTTQHESLLPCSKCNDQFASLRTLTAHQRNIHGIGGTPSSYAGHNRRWACDICSKSFQGRYKLVNHQFMTHGKNGEGLPVLKCEEPGCSYATLVKNEKDRHMKSHTEGKVVCEVCGAQYKRSTIKLHMTKIHKVTAGNENLTCLVCDEGFDSKVKLEYHMVKTHYATIKCTHCDFKTAVKQRLKEHLAIKHGQKTDASKRILRCEYCEYATFGITKMQRHMNSHSGLRPFHCEECNQGFNSPAAQKAHMRIHTGEKPYMCPVEGCTFATAFQSGIKHHITNRHVDPEEARTHMCHLCGYRAKVKGNLTLHLQRKHKLTVFNHHDVLKQRRLDYQLAQQKQQQQQHESVASLEQDHPIDVGTHTHVSTWVDSHTTSDSHPVV